MKIQKISISEINPAPYNPRKDLQPDDFEYQQLEASIKEFGFVEPIVWNERTKTLIAGHQRLKILIKNGVKEVHASVVDLSHEKEKALNIALNKIKGSWDEVKLASVLDELSVIPDFDVSVTGFEFQEISKIIDEQSRPKEDTFDFLSAVKAVKDSQTKLGDVIKLGKHRIMCGDSNNLDDLKQLMQEQKAQLVYTDPPYNVAYDNKARPIKNKNKKEWDEIQSDDLNQGKYEEWLKNIFTNIGCYFDEGATAYVWNGHKQFYFMHKVLTELEYHVSTVITWAKDNFAVSFAPYNWQTEHCLFFWKKNSGKHKWYGNGKQSNLWYAQRDPAERLIHPTQKPAALVIKALKNSSARDDIVLDLFLGSGSTLIAAEDLGRRCFGMEIDPRYCDAIVGRYIAFVGKENVSADILERYCKEVNNDK